MRTLKRVLRRELQRWTLEYGKGAALCERDSLPRDRIPELLIAKTELDILESAFEELAALALTPDEVEVIKGLRSGKYKLLWQVGAQGPEGRGLRDPVEE